MNTKLEREIQRLKLLRTSLLREDEVLWDEVNAVERDLKFLLCARELDKEPMEDRPYAAEDAAVAIMESAARKSNDEYR
ncbi:MAG: hypothetical protein HOK55_01665 [Gammaproteobacteria bacterium]|nr:hypothetical protein [Gammaproteobacteria bacterium]